MDTCFRWLADLAWRHGRAVLLAAVLLSGGSGLAVARLAGALETDFGALLPDDFPSVRTLEEIRRRVRGTENLVVVVGCPDFARSRQFIDDLAQELEREEYRPFVRYVDSRRDARFLRQHALLYVDLGDLREIRSRLAERIEGEKLRRSPLYVALDDEEEDERPFDLSDVEGKYGRQLHAEEYYASADSALVMLTAVAAGSSSNVGYGRAMTRAVQQAIVRLDPSSYHPGMKVEIGGSFRQKVEEYDVIRRDILLNVVTSLVCVALLLTLYFRQPLAVLFIMAPLVMGVLWSFALAYFVVGNLNTITGFLFGVLFGLGIDFGIHLFSRYLEARMGGSGVQLALETMLVRTGRAMLTAGTTTVAAFLALVVTDFKGFSEFGLIAAMGVSASMLAMVTVLPAALVLADRDLGLVRMRPVWGHGCGALRGRYPRPRLVLALAGGVTLLLGLNVPRVEFEYDFTNLRTNLPATRAVKESIDQIQGRDRLSESPSVVLTDSREELDEAVAAAEARMAAPDATPTIAAVRTLWSSLPTQQEEKLAVISAIRRLVDGNYGLFSDTERARIDSVRPLLDVGPLTVDNLPASIRRRFTDRDGKLAYLAFIYPSVRLRDGRNAMAFAEDAEALRAPSGRVYRSSSPNIIFADMLRLMLADSRTALALTALTVFVIVWADLRSLRRAELVVLPLACALAWMVGLMPLFGLKLNFYNMVILPSIIGMGIDNGVHLYHRYREEGPGSLPLVLARTGGAMLICVLTTMVGFAGLIAARHPGLNSIGVLAQIGLASSFLAAVTALPALLQVLEDRTGKPAAPEGEAPVSSSTPF